MTSPTLLLESQLFRDGHRRIAAIDEVGRGALAGPVSVGVAVISHPCAAPPAGLRDSKLLTPEARTKLVAPVRAWVQEFAVGHAEPAEIDAWGIVTALRVAALRALAEVRGPVDVVLLDGSHNYLADPEPALLGEPVMPPGYSGLVRTQVKADRDCASVAAASVLAKVERDILMVQWSQRFPRYEWDRNKGYGTAAHTAALREWGATEWHRRSWQLPARAAAPSGDNTGDDGRQATLEGVPQRAHTEGV